MRWLYWGLGVLIIASAAVTIFAVRLMSDVGSFRTINAHFEGTCETIPGFVGGTEDIQIDHETGWIFVSAYDRWAGLEGGALDGAIQIYHPDHPMRGHLNLTAGIIEDFRPHGISLYSGPEGKRLFVISHPGDGSHRIEVFDVTYVNDEPQLAHVETIMDDLIVSPNDLFAVGWNEFYVGNDSPHSDHTTLAYTIDTYLRLSNTNLIHYRDGEMRVAADGLTYANGVAVSADGLLTYVAETTDGVLRIYDRDPETGDLALREDGMFRFSTGLDNIDIDAEGRIWIGAHPKLFDFAAHAQDPSALSPSQIIMLDPADDGEGGHIHEVFMDDGSLASGSAVGAFHDGVMYIGLVFASDVIACQVTDPLVVGS